MLLFRDIANYAVLNTIIVPYVHLFYAHHVKVGIIWMLEHALFVPQNFIIVLPAIFLHAQLVPKDITLIIAHAIHVLPNIPIA